MGTKNRAILYGTNDNDVVKTNEVVITTNDFDALEQIEEQYNALDLVNNIPVRREEFAKLLADSASLEALNLETNTLVDTEGLNKFMALNSEYKSDILTLVNMFLSFKDLFSGKINPLTIASTIGKIMKDDKLKAQFSDIVALIDKYSPKPAEINGKGQ